MSQISRPFDLLSQATNKPILVFLKGNKQIRGTLVAFDQHLNLVLQDAEELENNTVKVKLGSALIRGDNILYLSP
ncbi:MAG: LSm family protein [archaeon]